MNPFFQTGLYSDGMATRRTTSPLRALREASGLSLRELARQLGEHPSNVSYWETSGQPPRADLIVPLSKLLGATVEQVLGETPSKRSTPAGGKLGQLFEQITRLPKRRQQKIVEVVEAMVMQQKALEASA